MFSNPKKNVEEFGLNPGFKVADFGSGSGFYTFEAAEKVGDTGKVYALDIQKELLLNLKNEAQKKNLLNIETIWADLDEVNGSSLSSQSLDAVIASNVFFQVPDKKALAEEIKRVLKKDGKVLVIDWTDSFGGLGPVQSSIFSREKVEELFLNLGFEKIKELEDVDHHYILMFKKL